MVAVAELNPPFCVATPARPPARDVVAASLLHYPPELEPGHPSSAALQAALKHRRHHQFQHPRSIRLLPDGL
jgi:hypothetical protein